MRKKTIAVDIDDVLADLAKAFIKLSNEQWGTKVTIEDIEEDWGEVWQVSEAERKSRAEFLHSGEFFNSLMHFKEAKKILKELKTTYSLVVVTSRSKKVNDKTKEWIERYFPGVFDNVYHSGIFDGIHTEETFKMTKVQACLDLGVDYLIDDYPKHCIGVDKVGIKALLFGEYPWNKNALLPKTIIRVKNWQEVKNYFDNED